MTGFLELPRRLRERIYREVLVRKGTTSFTDFRTDCNGRRRWIGGQWAPPLLRVSSKVDREAAPLYFGSNHFRSDKLQELGSFFWKLPSRHIHLVGRLTVVFEPSSCGHSERKTLERITTMVKARRTTVLVDERSLAVKELCGNKAIQWHPVLGLPAQLRLYALRAIGTRALQRLAETPAVELREGNRQDSRSFQAAVIAPYTVERPQ